MKAPLNLALLSRIAAQPWAIREQTLAAWTQGIFPFSSVQLLNTLRAPMSNPAERLHEILKRCRSKELQQKPTVFGWRRVLKLPDEHDDLFVMSKVGKVFTLTSQITTQIERFPDVDRELFLGWRGELTDAFNHIYFNQHFDSFASKLRDTLLLSIRHCSHELDRRAPEKEIALEDLGHIRELAWTLYQEILVTGLPPLLFRYLLEHLYLIIEAIDDVEIFGSAGLERAVNATVGTIVTDAQTAKEAGDLPQGGRLWEILGKVTIVLKLGKTALELAEGLRKALP